MRPRLISRLAREEHRHHRLMRLSLGTSYHSRFARQRRISESNSGRRLSVPLVSSPIATSINWLSSKIPNLHHYYHEINGAYDPKEQHAFPHECLILSPFPLQHPEIFAEAAENFSSNTVEMSKMNLLHFSEFR